MSRCARACPRRYCRRWLPDGHGERNQKPRNLRGVIFAERGTQEQTCVDGATTKSDLESLADNDIHRLVRVTARKRSVQETAS